MKKTNEDQTKKERFYVEPKRKNRNVLYFHTSIECVIEDVEISCMLDSGFYYADALTYSPHSHLAYELHYVVSGTYDMEVCDAKNLYRLNPGDIFIIPPGSYHNIWRDKEYEEERGKIPDSNNETFNSIRKFALRFTVNKSAKPSTDQYYSKIISVMPQKEPITLKVQKAEELLTDLHRELTNSFFLNDTLAESTLSVFFIYLFRAIIQRDEENVMMSSKDILQKQTIKYAAISRRENILKYMDKNYHRQITEKDLADEMHLSVRQISRIFSEQFSSTFRKTLTEIRMHQAEKLLERTDVSAEKISAEVGYASPSAFFTLFKQKYGMSPGEYRKKVRNRE